MKLVKHTQKKQTNKQKIRLKIYNLFFKQKNKKKKIVQLKNSIYILIKLISYAKKNDF